MILSFHLFLYLFAAGAVAIETMTHPYWKSIGFKCPEVPCEGTILQTNGYFHMIVGTDHTDSFILFLHKVCEAFQRCMDPSRFIFVLHRTSKPSKNYQKILNIILLFNMQYTEWIGRFDSQTKLFRSYAALKNVTDPSSVIYHTDVDEMVDESPAFLKSLEQLKAGGCDAIRGSWKDRLHFKGELKSVRAPKSGRKFQTLQKQFPLRCDVSRVFVGNSMFSKTVVYRANRRVDGGQHEVWCDKSGLSPKQKLKIIKQGGSQVFNETYSVVPWNMFEACKDHFVVRNKHSEFASVYEQIPRATSRPIYCDHRVEVRNSLNSRWSFASDL